MVTSLVSRGFGREMLSSFARDPVRTLQSELDDIFNRILARHDSEGALSAESYIPSLNLSETDSELQITMDVPGVKPEEVDIEVTGNTVRIRGEHREEKEEKGRTYHRIERRTGSFFRAVELPLRSQTGQGRGGLQRRRAEDHAAEVRSDETSQGHREGQREVRSRKAGGRSACAAACRYFTEAIGGPIES